MPHPHDSFIVVRVGLGQADPSTASQNPAAFQAHASPTRMIRQLLLACLFATPAIAQQGPIDLKSLEARATEGFSIK